MARMHSRKKGKSSSKKPLQKKKYSWLRHDAKEIEELIIKLAKENNSPSKIGLILRDSYGIPCVKDIISKSVTKILQENSLLPEIPEDLQALIVKEVKILKHLEKNKKDMTAKRGLQLTESKIHRLVKYYKRTGRLPQNWKYDINIAKLLVG